MPKPLRIGQTLWDLRTGERFTFAGINAPGLYHVKNARGLRRIGAKHLSRGSRTAERARHA